MDNTRREKNYVFPNPVCVKIQKENKKLKTLEKNLKLKAKTNYVFRGPKLYPS